MPEIILEKVTKRFDKFTAVKELDLLISDRGFVTLLGPSGCGKTTTLRMIAGLETPTSGRILIDGKPVFDSQKGINVPPNKRDIGFLFQNYALWPHMTVYENIAFGLEMLKWDKAKIRARVDELLALLKIEPFEKRYPSELSGGQQQRVAIARTLAPSPKVLFMDEPLSNLDAKLRQEMRTELKRLHSDTNSTFVYVTHDQLEAMTLSTQVCLMDNGVLQQYAPPLAIYNRPANLFVAEFVGNPTINFIPAKVKSVEGCCAKLSLLGTEMTFAAQAPIEGLGSEAVLGVRPEFLPIRDNGSLSGTIYSTLPTGMETTVKAECGGAMLTSVVFGSVDYAIDTEVKLEIVGDGIVLFDKESGNSVGVGSVSRG
ncbi:MAG: ABC transporter ATP-binding protein [Clostridiales bacterium]|nr:ABC transporter ATP-binding protein [Clostridiales bacterium]MDY4008671.1 ABC transporter ATP-binding protein [Candidatus Limiplasma sp.]